MVKNPTYTGIGPRFWQSLDLLGNASELTYWGTPNCGKGQPGQIGHTGRRVTRIAVGDRKAGDVLGEAALKVGQRGAINDDLRIHQRRRRDDESLRLDIAEPREVIGKDGVFGRGGGHRGEVKRTQAGWPLGDGSGSSGGNAR